ncbi:hypothetical protein LXL04_019167 [Taraxacum kok-saghyz]
MDFLLHYRNPNFHSSSVALTSNKVNNKLHAGREVEKKKNKRNNKISTKVKLSTDPQSVAARERRHRISERFKILRSLIPGGDTRNMDTVSMLEEAIQYVKFLKAQIWLQQTMISFENCDDYDNANRNYHHYDQYSHQNLLPSDIFNSDHHHLSSLPQMEHEIVPQLGFEDGSCFKVEDEDNMFSHVPNKVLAQLEAICCRFFWGSRENERIILWVAWKVAMNSLDQGGLGIGSLRAGNIARLMHSLQEIWVLAATPLAATLRNVAAKGLVAAKGSLDGHLSVNKRNTVWGKICRLDEDLTEVDMDIKDLMQEIQGCWRWSLEADGEFSVKSLRKALDDKYLVSDNMATSWCKTMPKKINIFVWRARRHRLATKLNLIKRNVPGVSPICPLCNVFDETEDHLFIKCSTAKVLMAKLQGWWSDLPNLDNIRDLDELLNRCHGRNDEVKYQVVICAFMWSFGSIGTRCVSKERLNPSIF